MITSVVTGNPLILWDLENLIEVYLRAYSRNDEFVVLNGEEGARILEADPNSSVSHVDFYFVEDPKKPGTQKRMAKVFTKNTWLLSIKHAQELKEQSDKERLERQERSEKQKIYQEKRQELYLLLRKKALENLSYNLDPRVLDSLCNLPLDSKDLELCDKICGYSPSSEKEKDKETHEKFVEFFKL